MINDLINAYRAQFYDWGTKKWIAFFKKSKFHLFLLIAISISFTFILVAIINNSLVILLLPAVCMIILFILADRVLVNNYQENIKNRKSYLQNVADLLQSVIHQADLSNSSYLDEAIKRLSDYIEQNEPFKKATHDFVGFGKTVALPTLTFFIGKYNFQFDNSSLPELLTASTSVILCIALFWWPFKSLSDCDSYFTTKILFN